LIQPWIVAAHGSNSLAKSLTLRPLRTNAAICSLNSAGYGFLVLGVRTLSSHSQTVSIKPGECHEHSLVNADVVAKWTAMK